MGSRFNRFVGLTRYYYLLRAVIYRDLVVWLRYPINAVLGVLVHIFLFLLLFYGGTVLTGGAITDSIEGIIIGYFLLTLSNSAYAGLTTAIQTEASWGTLERHYLTPLGFIPVVFARSLSILFRTFLTSAFVLFVMVGISGTHLNIPVLTVIVVAVLSVTSVIGVGLATGGLSVLYKKVGAINDLFGFVFASFIAAPVFHIPWTSLFPLAHGSALLQRVMKDGVRLWEFDPTILAHLFAVAIAYLIAGYAVFRFASRRARHLGTLGDY